jgi:hypothetical protein
MLSPQTNASKKLARSFASLPLSIKCPSQAQPTSQSCFTVYPHPLLRSKLLAMRVASTVFTGTRLSLEAGGNAPFIVFNDADVEAAVQGTTDSRESCTRSPPIFQGRLNRNSVTRVKCAYAQIVSMYSQECIPHLLQSWQRRSVSLKWAMD